MLVFDMIALNEKTTSFFCLPHLVEKSVFSMLSICFALVMVSFICCENVSFGSKVISSILQYLFIGSVCLINLSNKVMPYSARSGVKKFSGSFQDSETCSLYVVKMSVLDQK